MERVRLTKEEKRVLRWLQRNNGGKLKQIEKLAFAPAVRSLEQKGLVRGFCSEEVLLMQPSLKAAKLIFSLIHVCKIL